MKNEPLDNILDSVNPFIGTGFHGHTFPGATLPFGMVQLSPDTHLDGWDASSGYHYDDHQIFGFSHTHLSGTGIGDLGDIAILPFSGGHEQIPIATFNKNQEYACPGYYRVALDNYDILAELTTTTRVGLHRYTYQNPEDRQIMFNLSHILQPSWGGAVLNNTIEIIDQKTIQGIRKTTGWAHDHVVAFCMEFSEAFEAISSTLEIEIPFNTTFQTKDGQIYFKFSNSEKPLLVKVAISPTDAQGARKNLQDELPGWDFESTKFAAEDSWKSALDGINITTNDPSIKTNFYTALYHSMMSPIVWQDVDGRYRGMNKQIIQAPKDYTNYTVFSLWDTFRAFHPLMTIIRPDMAVDWSKSLVQKYKEGGILPKWPLVSNYTGTMVGYPAVSVIADAINKELITSDLNDYLEAAVQSAIWRQDIAAKFKGTREERVMPKHIYFKETLGWVPSDSLPESVSYGLEMAYYDWCVAQIAQAAGDHETASAFLEKSTFFRNYFDYDYGLMRGKNYDGSWVSPFRPRYSSHEKSDYVEGNAWQWSFFTPHAIDQWIDMLGGPDRLEAMLDTLFTTDSSIEGENASGDITGLIGQYAHGNEPSHHMAYLYHWTNSPHKAQERLDQIMYDFYSPEPAGIIGNEDCGQMSAWYIISAMGFYQICPGDPKYVIGRPLIDQASIRVPGGVFEIVAHNNSRENKYVQKVYLNGKELQNSFFTHDTLMQGGKLEFFMSHKM